MKTKTKAMSLKDKAVMKWKLYDNKDIPSITKYIKLSDAEDEIKELRELLENCIQIVDDSDGNRMLVKEIEQKLKQ